MTGSQENALRNCGKPLFFRVDSLSARQLRPPQALAGEALRIAVRSLSVMQKEALVVSARSGATWRLASDEGAYLAGLDEAPCPLAFFTTGMVCATLDEVLALAQQRHITLQGVRLVQDNFYTMTGSALAGTMRGGARDVRLRAQISGAADCGSLEQLVHDAVIASPLTGLLRNPMESLFTLTHNGLALQPARAAALAEKAEPDPGPCFDSARPAPGDWSGLVRRGGMTPKLAHSVTLAGGSLAVEQNRLLHIRGICTLRKDGVRQVEVQLFNPHGSVFHLLCDAAPGQGGHGLAPDALSYVAAGIAFCFMTQLGRYASITRKHLGAYSVVQDARFSSGGADPVTTHVHLRSGEADDVARAMVDMAQQTCFLHALCKASLKTRIAVQPWSEEEVELPDSAEVTGETARG